MPPNLCKDFWNPQDSPQDICRPHFENWLLRWTTGFLVLSRLWVVVQSLSQVRLFGTPLGPRAALQSMDWVSVSLVWSTWKYLCHWELFHPHSPPGKHSTYSDGGIWVLIEMPPEVRQFWWIPLVLSDLCSLRSILIWGNSQRQHKVKSGELLG